MELFEKGFEIVLKESNLEFSNKSNFIKEIIESDLKAGKNEGRVNTRFPPEPNGYLHIGHAKAICLNFGIAMEYGGVCNLRFDDTNPESEEARFVKAIQEDIKWLRFDWGKRLYFASDYFEQMYTFAVKLIKSGKAYVDSQSIEDIRKNRGTIKSSGIKSPFRNRPVEENLALFEKMRDGAFDEGACVLRAKIDMASPNMLMRDPLMYRIKKIKHHRKKGSWNIYPMYDFAHCLEDSIEKITHSLCSIEFENNRPLYDWFLDNLDIFHPQQIEFARMNLSYTVMSKRVLAKLVEDKEVDGWDDPRLPTLSGLKRRGYTPSSIVHFCKIIGIAKRESVVDFALLEYVLRQELNQSAQRRMAVLNPLKVVIENYPKDKIEMLDAVNNPENEADGKRKVPFSRVLYIERDDFMVQPPKKFFRLSVGKEVRLRYAYFLKCRGFEKDSNGDIVQLNCTYDPASKGGNSPDGRKVKTTIHWVSAKHAIEARVKLYDRLFNTKNPTGDDVSISSQLNSDSLKVLNNCKLEPSLAAARVGQNYQFERKGYFCLDSKGDFTFNRTVTLRDTWRRLQKNQINRSPKSSKRG